MALRKWRNFFALTASEQWLILQAYVLTWAVRLQLWLLPFTMTRRVTASWARTQGLARSGEDAATICRAVTRAAGYVPAATCLTQALTAWILLSRLGLPSSIRFGVMPNGRGRIVAHAWVEAPPSAPNTAPRVLIGGDASPRRFVPLERSRPDDGTETGGLQPIAGRAASPLHT
jgi:Transglutaminase-like superfamily